MLKYLAAVGVALFALWPAGVSAAPAWEQGSTVPGVFDLGGPRSDGSLIVAGSGALYALTPEGPVAPFAKAIYHDDAGGEAYLAVSPGLPVPVALGCAFPFDDAYILRLHAPIGVTEVDASGTNIRSLANVDLPGLSGIAFDTSGSFGHLLLVTGSVNGKTELVAVDCTGNTRVITRTAPTVEGGLSVAPLGFGAFGGDLIGADEVSGVIWALAPDGTSSRVVDSGLPKGGDIGVESVAFVPAGFISRGGFVYYSDRSTPGNPHPGTDHVLRLSSGDLAAAGVQDGDLLAATEGGASMIDVRCGTGCTVSSIVATPTTAHGEGHLVFTLNPLPLLSPPSAIKPATRPPAAAGNGSALTAAAGALAFLAAAIFAASRRRRR